MQSWWRSLSNWERTAVVLWSAAILAVCVRVSLFPTRQTVWHDYGDAGRAWAEGGDVYKLDRGDGAVRSMSGFRYAPIVAVLLTPFASLPDTYANVSWRLFGLAFFLVGLWSCVHAGLPGIQLTPRQTGMLWLLVMPLSLASINNGQANVLLIGLLLAACAAVAKERWNVAAGFLAGAVLLKLYPIAVALLLICMRPRALGWRFTAAVLIGLALPFACQSPDYVWGKYKNWLALVASDNRNEFPLTEGYRDFYLLTRAVGSPLEATTYRLVQLAAALVIAAVALGGKYRAWSTHHMVRTLVDLGCAWMVVFGPSVESCTFIQIAAPLAWGLIETHELRDRAWSKWTLRLIFVLFVAAFATSWFRVSRDWLYLAQPIAALLFLIERLAQAVGDLSIRQSTLTSKRVLAASRVCSCESPKSTSAEMAIS